MVQEYGCAAVATTLPGRSRTSWLAVIRRGWTFPARSRKLHGASTRSAAAAELLAAVCEWHEGIAAQTAVSERPLQSHRKLWLRVWPAHQLALRLAALLASPQLLANFIHHLVNCIRHASLHFRSQTLNGPFLGSTDADLRNQTPLRKQLTRSANVIIFSRP